MIPGLDPDTCYLPPGIHAAVWGDVAGRFAGDSHRARLTSGLLAACRNLAAAGCRRLLLNGSFVSAKALPGDDDAAWETAGVDPDLLDPVLLDFSNRRAAMKARNLGDPVPGVGAGRAGSTLSGLLQDRPQWRRERRRVDRSGELAMITNERQYRITRKKALEFAGAIEAFDAGADARADVHPRLLQAEREAMESQLADLRAELDEYEQLKSADLSVIPVASLEELAEGLIKARIAGGLSQRSLARRLKLKEQQVQRYEADRYAGASFRRLCQVARALDVRVENEMLLSVVPSERSRNI